jgi:acid stress-induced BolA-like protein IbaG/YrbA
MGWVLIFFGAIKLSDVVGFADGFAKYDPLAKRSIIYAQVYPFLEITLGALFILQLLILPVTLITLFIYSASLYGALQSMMKKESLHCVCLGTYFKLPLSTVTVIEASFMIVMCIWMLVMFNSMTMVM